MIRMAGAICCDYNDTWQAEKNFINRRSLQDLCPKERKHNINNSDIKLIERSVEEKFEEIRIAA